LSSLVSRDMTPPGFAIHGHALGRQCNRGAGRCTPLPGPTWPCCIAGTQLHGHGSCHDSGRCVRRPGGQTSPHNFGRPERREGFLPAVLQPDTSIGCHRRAFSFCRKVRHGRPPFWLNAGPCSLARKSKMRRISFCSLCIGKYPCGNTRGLGQGRTRSTAS
jgi:hypothetical protein